MTPTTTTIELTIDGVPSIVDVTGIVFHDGVEDVAAYRYVAGAGFVRVGLTDDDFEAAVDALWAAAAGFSTSSER